MERRKFIGWIGVGGLATYLPMAMIACSPQASNDSQTSDSDVGNRADGFVAIATVAELEEKGHVVKKVNDVIVFKDPETSELVALNSLCTHQGCTVEWQSDQQNIYCSCHGSIFAKDGSVVEGPANKALARYEVKQENDMVLVKVV